MYEIERQRISTNTCCREVFPKHEYENLHLLSFKFKKLDHIIEKTTIKKSKYDTLFSQKPQSKEKTLQNKLVHNPNK